MLVDAIEAENRIGLPIIVYIASETLFGVGILYITAKLITSCLHSKIPKKGSIYTVLTID